MTLFIILLSTITMLAIGAMIWLEMRSAKQKAANDKLLADAKAHYEIEYAKVQALNASNIKTAEENEAAILKGQRTLLFALGFVITLFVITIISIIRRWWKNRKK